MLNIFPIQFLAPLAYLILRVCLGMIFVYLGRTHIKNRIVLKDVFTLPHFSYGLFFTWYISIVEILIGILLIIGLFTQIAAILAILFSLKLLILHKRFKHPLIPSRISLILILATSIGLLITGAGIFAFDLPI